MSHERRAAEEMGAADAALHPVALLQQADARRKAMFSQPAQEEIARLEAQVALLVEEIERIRTALTARAERAEATMIDENAALRDLVTSLIAARNETAVKADQARRWAGRWKRAAKSGFQIRSITRGRWKRLEGIHEDKLVDLRRISDAYYEQREARYRAELDLADACRQRDLLAYLHGGGSVGEVMAALGLPDGPDTQDWARLLETWRARGAVIVKGEQDEVV